jgi:hypothetical protein
MPSFRQSFAYAKLRYQAATNSKPSSSLHPINSNNDQHNTNLKPNPSRAHILLLEEGRIKPFRYYITLFSSKPARLSNTLALLQLSSYLSPISISPRKPAT